MDVMLALYKSFILPHLEYCSPLLLGVGKVLAHKIDSANHYILRTLTGHRKSLSYQELLRAVLSNFQLSSFGREKMKFLKLSQMNGLDK